MKTLADAAESWARSRRLAVPPRMTPAWSAMYAAWQRSGMTPNPAHRNPDEDLRDLERRAQAGDFQAALRLAQVSMRAGAWPPGYSLGHEVQRGFTFEERQLVGPNGPIGPVPTDRALEAAWRDFIYSLAARLRYGRAGLLKPGTLFDPGKWEPLPPDYFGVQEPPPSPNPRPAWQLGFSDPVHGPGALVGIVASRTGLTRPGDADRIRRAIAAVQAGDLNQPDATLKRDIYAIWRELAGLSPNPLTNKEASLLLDSEQFERRHAPDARTRVASGFAWGSAAGLSRAVAATARSSDVRAQAQGRLQRAISGSRWSDDLPLRTPNRDTSELGNYGRHGGEASLGALVSKSAAPVLQVLERAFAGGRGFTRDEAAHEAEGALRGARGQHLSTGSAAARVGHALSELERRGYVSRLGKELNAQGRPGPMRFALTLTGEQRAQVGQDAADFSFGENVVEQQVARLEAQTAPVRAAPGTGSVYRPSLPVLETAGHKLPALQGKRIRTAGYRTCNPAFLPGGDAFTGYFPGLPLSAVVTDISATLDPRSTQGRYRVSSPVNGSLLGQFTNHAEALEFLRRLGYRKHGDRFLLQGHNLRGAAPNPTGSPLSGPIRESVQGDAFIVYRPKLARGARPRLRVDPEHEAVLLQGEADEMRLALSRSDNAPAAALATCRICGSLEHRAKLASGVCPYCRLMAQGDRLPLGLYTTNAPRSKKCQMGIHDFEPATGLCRRVGCPAFHHAGQATLFGRDLDPTAVREALERERRTGQRDIFTPNPLTAFRDPGQGSPLVFANASGKRDLDLARRYGTRIGAPGDPRFAFTREAWTALMLERGGGAPNRAPNPLHVLVLGNSPESRARGRAPNPPAGTVGVEEVRAHVKMFHGAPVARWRLIEVDDGRPGITNKAYSALGLTEATVYSAPWNASNKAAGGVYEHVHEKRKPLEAFDPIGNVTTKFLEPGSGPSDWWRDDRDAARALSKVTRRARRGKANA